jgi:sec-independent protein translocase protein TatA
MNSPLLAIGPLGTWEMVIIAMLVLVLFGAKKLPTFARSLGKSMGEFKKAREEFESELTRAQEDVMKTPTPNPTLPPEQKRIPTQQSEHERTTTDV